MLVSGARTNFNPGTGPVVHGTVGTAVDTTLPAATGGNAPVTYSLDAELPGGLTFDAGTRHIAGTPTAPKVAMTYKRRMWTKTGLALARPR